MQYKKNFWEKFFVHPTFNIRFGFSVAFLIILSIICVTIGIKFLKISDLNEKLNFINVVIQGATFLFAVIAVYFAFRQLIESRLDKLKTNAYGYLKTKNYEKAIQLWKEAFYIKEEFDTFANLLEAYLITKSYKEFDEEIENLKKIGLIEKLVNGYRESIIFLFLKITRHLLTENIGNAKPYLENIINLIKEKNLTLERGFLMWDFSDLKQSEAYTNLKGESIKILDNLIRYLTDSMNFEERKSFEEGNYSLTN